jgi:hypothetical protein
VKELLGPETHPLRVLWDADFLFGPKGTTGANTYVPCEINVSAVWPYSPQEDRSSDHRPAPGREGTYCLK